MCVVDIEASGDKNPNLQETGTYAKRRLSFSSLKIV